MPPPPFDSMLPDTPTHAGTPESPPAGVLLFGGTFDPVHQGHTELGFRARDLAVPGGWLVFVPAAISPHKSDNPIPPTAGKHRVEMLRLACRSGGGRTRWWIWQEELTRAQKSDAPSYWVDTLESARKQLGEVSFLIGTDQALAFNRWHQWRRILELARPVVIGRDSVSTPDQLAESLANHDWSNEDADLFLNRSTVLDTPSMDINATSLRERLATGSTDPIPGLDPRVQRYAHQRGLYSSAE